MEDTRQGWIVGVIQLVFVIAVIALALVLTNLLAADDTPPAPGQITEAEDRAIEVSIASPLSETYTPSVRLNGVVQTQTQTNIAPQVGGRVVYVSPNFRPGASVERGETLFRIEAADFELAVEQAQANIDTAASDLALLKAEAAVAIEEWQDLFPGQQITDLAARRPQIAAAESRLASAQAAKKTAQLALSRTRIVAPDASRVLSTTLNEGQVVAPNTPVGTLFALESVEVRAPLSTQQVDILTPILNRPVTLNPRGDSESPIAGKVTRLDAALDPRTRLASIFIAPETLSGLTVGDFVDVTIMADTIDGAMVVPASAFFGRDEVWVVVDGTLERRRLLRIGEREGRVIVRSFDPAEGVVTLPPVEAYEGMNVSKRGASEDRQLAGAPNAG